MTSPRPKPIRKSVEDKVKVVLRKYRGKYLQITGLLHELGDTDVYITRDTARKWLVRLGCEAKGGGLFYVPLIGAETLAGHPPTEIAEEKV